MSAATSGSAGMRGRAASGLPEALILTVAAHYSALKQWAGIFRGRCPLCKTADSLWVYPEGYCYCNGGDCSSDETYDALRLIQAVEGIDAERARDRLRRRRWLPVAPIVYESRPVAPRKKPARKPRLKQICGAKNRAGTPCQCKQLGRGGRCKFHGGLSTGPKTPAGKARSFQNLTSWKAEQGARDARAQGAAAIDQRHEAREVVT